MDLRQLRYFVEIVERGGFTRAAAALRVGQPGLSAAIRKLEADLGTPLLERAPRKVTLTSDGCAVFHHAQEILARIDGLKDELRDRQALVRGELVVGLPPMLATHVFTDLIQSFRERNPGLELSIITAGARGIETRIAGGELDVGIIARHGAREDLVFRSLMRDEVVACVSRHHRLARRRSVTIENVAREPLILFAPGYFQRDFLDGAFAKRGLSPRIVLATDFVPLLVEATARGGGVTTLLRLAAEAEKRLVPLSFRPEISVEAGLAWRSGAYVSRAARAFIDFMANAVTRGSKGPRGQR